MNKIVITVPHKKDLLEIKRKRHVADFSAGNASDILKKSLEKSYKIKKFDGTVNRTECDLNRIEARRRCCSFRPALTRYLKTNKNEILLLFDVHSFPDEKNQDFDVFFIVQDVISKYYTLHLSNFLQNSGFVCSKVLNGIRNDIIGEGFSCFCIPSILIEFNENRESKYDSICFEIAKWTSKIFQNQTLQGRRKCFPVILKIKKLNIALGLEKEKGFLKKSCSYCNNENIIGRCSRCKYAKYCSEKCQKEHWLSIHACECINV